MIFTNLNSSLFIFLFFTILFASFSFYFFYSKQTKFNKNFRLLATNPTFFIKFLFLFLSFLILLFSLLEPKIWDKKLEIKSEWVDILFTLDVSKSMNVADISDWKYDYTRLDIIKSSIAQFVQKHPNDRFWLVIFAWDAISTIPLTTDHGIFLTFLKWVDYRNLTKQWTDFKKAISLSVDRFSSESKRSKVLILISDWWDEDEKLELSYVEQIKEWKKEINYFVVWVWTNKGWKIITWKDVFWNLSYQTYNWEYVVSKLNFWALEKLSSALNWDYFKINNSTDLLKLNWKIDNLKKEVIQKEWFWEEKKNIWRFLAMISFIFFILFLLFYTFEDRIFRKKEND